MAEVQTKTIEPRNVMSLAFTGPFDQTGDMLDELIAWVLRAGHPYAGPPMAIYYDDPAKVNPEELRAEVALPIEEVCEGDLRFTRKRLPGCEVAYAVHTGPYSQIKPLYEEIFAWIAENGYRHVEGSGAREIFLTRPGEEGEGDEGPVTEVQVPVEKV